VTHTLAWTRTWSALRAVMAVVILAAVIAQLSKSLGTAAADGRDVATVFANFFSFFTILSNVLAAIVLLWAALWLWTGRRTSAPSGDAKVEPTGLAVAMASVSTYMIITGIVYNALLRSIVLPQGSEPIFWSNEVLHLVAPLFLLADVFVGPARRSLPWSRLAVVIAFPIAWVVYTLVRGPLVINPASGVPYWYPYPFLDPNGAGGWPSVVLYVVLISVAFLVVGSFVIWWRRRTGLPRPAPTRT